MELKEHKLFIDTLAFATKAHDGIMRKSQQDVPYIVHPVLVASILAAENNSIELIQAGLLHDTVEDTSVTMEEIYNTFGNKVGDIVKSHTENKVLSWEERKNGTIDEMSTGNFDTVSLVLADKIANLYDALDYQDAEWGCFKRGKELQFWYNYNIWKNVIVREDYMLYQNLLTRLGRYIYTVFGNLPEFDSIEYDFLRKRLD